MTQFDYRKGIKQEWYETDSRSAWAAGTASGPNTRRQHALFGHIDEEGERWVLLNHFEEWITLGGRRFPLTSTIYFDAGAEGGMTVYPKGYQHLAAFSAFPYPRWTFQIEGHRITRTLRPLKNLDGFILEYADLAANGARPQLWIRPMISGRKPDDLHMENEKIEQAGAVDGSTISFAPYPGLPPVHLTLSDDGTYTPNPNWYRRIRLISNSRDEEALFSPGEIQMTLSPGQPAWILLSTRRQPIPSGFEKQTIFREEQNLPPEPTAALRRTIWYTDAPEPFSAFFSFDRSDGGCPAEEAMYSLLLTGDRLDDSHLARLLRGYRSEMNEAPLDLKLIWTILLAEATRRGISEERDALPTLELIERLIGGRGSATAEPLLLRCARPEDSWWGRHDERKLPRVGYPIDIQALWINALASAEIIDKSHRPSPGGTSRFSHAYLKASDAVKRLFWDPSRNGLHDMLDVNLEPGNRESSAALLVQALRFDVFSPSRTRSIIRSVRRATGATGGEPIDGESVFGFRPFADNRRVFPWLLALWWNAFDKHSDSSATRIATDGLRRLVPKPTELFLPYSLEVGGATQHGGLRLDFDRPSILSIAAYLVGLLREKTPDAS